MSNSTPLPHHTTGAARPPGRRRRTRAVLAAALVTLTAGAGTTLAPAPAGADGQTIAWMPVTDRASVDSSGTGGTTPVSNSSFVSDDGRYVVFDTESPLVPDDTNGIRDVYRHDRLEGI